jgi:hypothetical protein
LKISFRFIISLNCTFATDLPYFLWLNEENRDAAFSENLLTFDILQLFCYSFFMGRPLRVQDKTKGVKK